MRISNPSRKEKEKKKTTNTEVYENWIKAVCLCSKKVLGQFNIAPEGILVVNYTISIATKIRTW